MAWIILTVLALLVLGGIVGLSGERSDAASARGQERTGNGDSDNDLLGDWYANQGRDLDADDQLDD